eukprot:COSAG05_NODE_2493_length_2990_cov_1.086129_4_plen_72_part_00
MQLFTCQVPCRHLTRVGSFNSSEHALVLTDPGAHSPHSSPTLDDTEAEPGWGGMWAGKLQAVVCESQVSGQ